MNIQSINPANGELLTRFAAMDQTRVEEIIRRAHESFTSWRKLSFAERARSMKRAAGLLKDGAEECALLMAREMGKPIRQGRQEAEKCAWVCEHYAEHAGEYLAPEPVQTEASRSYVFFQPIGVVLAIMPWNYPFWQVFRFAAPALMAGNGCLLKHASNVAGCALRIEEILRNAGFPQDLFTVLLIGSSDVPAVIDNPLVRAVTLTGSGPAGSAVAQTAGRALKKTVLELGGSDPYIILEDADLESAAQTCVESRLLNSGQSCISAKRFVVAEPVRERFEALLVSGMRARRLGDPLLEDTEIGPLAREDLREQLHEQVQGSVGLGARCLLGGELPEGEGFYYPATVLSGVKRGMPVFEEETFGPVAAVISAASEDEAVDLANESSYGLGAAVFTRDQRRGETIAAERLDAGSCFVNDFVKSDPRLPFGGIKESGYGRELSRYGIREFMNIKTVLVR